MEESRNINFRAGPEEQKKLARMTARTGLTSSAVLRLLVRTAEFSPVLLPVCGQPLMAVGEDSGGDGFQTNAAAA